ASNFPILKLTLGDDDFESLARAYIDAYPSNRPSIRWYGKDLVAWLDADPGRVAHAALIDLARMEWALGTAFDAADGSTVSFEDLASIAAASWPSLRFVAHPSTRLIRLGWAIEPLWKALTADSGAQTDPPEPVEHHLLVWRDGFETQWRSLENDEAELMEA